MRRRELLVAGAAGTAGLVLPQPGAFAARRRAEPLARAGTFPLGVASGQPAQRGISLWTKVAGLERASKLTLEIAADPDFRTVVDRRQVRAAPIRGYAVKQRVESRRLRPGEQYWYRFATRTSSSDVGRFRTARPADSRERVRIAVFSCQKYHQGFYTPHAALAREGDLDLVVCLGDYVYEERNRSQPIAARQDRLGANGDGEVQTLAEFRAKYDLYKADPDLRAMHAAHPFTAIWDDHEVENDYAGAAEGDVVQRRIPFEERKRAGYLSFFEHHPVDVVRGDRFRLHRRISLGAHADVFLLDERQYRDPLLCEPVTPCLAAVPEPPRTLLGREQLAWLKAELEGSRASWKLLLNQVMAMGLDLPTGVPINADQWDGYAAERRELLEHVLAKGVKDVSFLTGDIHTFFAGTVTTSGRVGAPRAATEFVAGSITSEGIAEQVGGQPALADRIGLLNPHIAYTETSRRGYAIVEAWDDELLVKFRAPATVLEPTSPVTDLARFRVTRGSTMVERLL